jgi:hypothetical protein
MEFTPGCCQNCCRRKPPPLARPGARIGGARKGRWRERLLIAAALSTCQNATPLRAAARRPTARRTTAAATQAAFTAASLTDLTTAATAGVINRLERAGYETGVAVTTRWRWPRTREHGAPTRLRPSQNLAKRSLIFRNGDELLGKYGCPKTPRALRATAA